MFRSRISSELIITLAKGSRDLKTDEARQLMIIEKIITLHAPNDIQAESHAKGKLSSVKTGCCGSVPLYSFKMWSQERHFSPPSAFKSLTQRQLVFVLDDIIDDSHNLATMGNFLLSHCLLFMPSCIPQQLVSVCISYFSTGKSVKMKDKQLNVTQKIQSTYNHYSTVYIIVFITSQIKQIKVTSHYIRPIGP